MPISNYIKIKGARVHNLKNINVNIPRNKFVVITGLSGSGKSSLAFDTIYAEGQRRYVESLSAYARQFIGLMDKPDVDLIEGLSPAISIDQKSTSHNPRSTVGTVTEVYDYLRLLFARIGVPHCPECDKKIRQYTVDEIVNRIIKLYGNFNVIILAPLVRDKKGEHKNILASLSSLGFNRIRFDKNIYTIEEFNDMEVDKQKKHTLEIVIDRIKITKNKEDLARLTEDIEKSLDIGKGLTTITTLKEDDIKETTFSQALACPDCDINLPELEPRNFSFNSPHGACPDCSGLGTKLKINHKLIINPNLTLAQGAIRGWTTGKNQNQTWLLRILGTVASQNGFDLNTYVKDLTKKQLNIVLYGTGDKKYDVEYESSRFSGELNTKFEGVINNLERRHLQTESDYIRKEIEQYMQILQCSTCDGKRLKKEILAVRIKEKNISEITNMNIKDCKKWINSLK